MKILIVLALAVTSIITAHTGEMPGLSQAMANTEGKVVRASSTKSEQAANQLVSQTSNRSSVQSDMESVNASSSQTSGSDSSGSIGGGSELAPDYTMTCAKVEDTLFCSTGSSRLKTETYLRNAAGMDQYAQQVMKKGIYPNGNLVEGDHLLQVSLDHDGSFKRIHYSIVGISAQAYAKSRGCAEVVGLMPIGLRKLEIRCKNPIGPSGQLSSGSTSVNSAGGMASSVNQGHSVARASIQRVAN